MEDKKSVGHLYEDAEIFQSSILEARQVEHAGEVRAAEERARVIHKQKKVCFRNLAAVVCVFIRLHSRDLVVNLRRCVHEISSGLRSYSNLRIPALRAVAFFQGVI